MKKTIVLSWLMIMVAVIFSALPAEAAWLRGGIPLPSSTQEVKKEKRDFKEMDFEVSFFASKLSEEEIREFYRLKLEGLGWKEKNTYEQLKAMPEFSAPGSLFGVFKNTLIFEKENSAIIINFTSFHGGPAQAKTKFILCLRTVYPQRKPAQPFRIEPDFRVSRIQQFIPAYPGAILVNSAEKSGALMEGYLSGDGIGEIAYFYKNNLPAHGWVLERDDPPQAIDYAKDKAAAGKELTLKKLLFKKTGGDSAEIYLARQSGRAGGKNGAPQETLITIKYEKKK